MKYSKRAKGVLNVSLCPLGKVRVYLIDPLYAPYFNSPMLYTAPPHPVRVTVSLDDSEPWQCRCITLLSQYKSLLWIDKGRS